MGFFSRMAGIFGDFVRDVFGADEPRQEQGPSTVGEWFSGESSESERDTSWVKDYVEDRNVAWESETFDIIDRNEMHDFSDWEHFTVSIDGSHGGHIEWEVDGETFESDNIPIRDLWDFVDDILDLYDGDYDVDEDY